MFGKMEEQKQKLFKPKTPLRGNIFSFGKIGSGKTWKFISILQYYHSKGYKIFDFYGGLRREQGFWCFPSEEKKMWRDFEDYVGVIEGDWSKKYNITLL